MTEHTLFALLPSRALVRVTGPDWRGFLQGLLTQDVETLAPGELRFAGLLTPQGKLLFDLFLFGQDDGCLIDVAADRREAMIQRLTIYRLRAKVEIEADPGLVSAMWPAPAQLGAGWAIDPRLAALGARGYGADAPAGAHARDEAVYEAHRLALGAPDPARDCPPETTYPIEANFDLLGGIDFKKGCFVGQETTSRMKRRGQIKSRIAPIVYDGPALEPGAEVMAGELRAGRVLSGVPGRSLALLRIDRALNPSLTVLDRPVGLDVPSWLATSFALDNAAAEA
jgi:folate-binding protein YgfZ